MQSYYRLPVKECAIQSAEAVCSMHETNEVDTRSNHDHIARAAQLGTGFRTRHGSELVTVSFFFAFTFCSLDSNFFVVFLKRCKIFPRFAELTFLHALANIPMYKCSFAVHEVELVINARKDFSDCC